MVFGEETPSRLTYDRPNSAKSWDVLLMILVSRLKFKDVRNNRFLQVGLLTAQLYLENRWRSPLPCIPFITAPLGARGHLLKILGSGDRHLLSPGFRRIISFYVRCFSHQTHSLEALWIPRVLVACWGNNKLRMKECPQSLFGWYRLIKYLQFVGFYALWFFF